MVLIREATWDDVAEYTRLQEEEWDDSMAAVGSKIESRIDIFPSGVLIAEHDGQIVAGVSFIRLNGYDVTDHLSWEDLTDNGWCTTHVEGGNVLFGVDLSVSRRAPRSTAPLIFMAAMELGMRLGVEQVIWGGRMPRYHKYADRMTAVEYASKRTRRGRFLDPEIDLYSKIPGVEILGVVPEYFKDWESLNHGVMLAWSNPIKNLRVLRIFRRQVLSFLYRSSRRTTRAPAPHR